MRHHDVREFQRPVQYTSIGDSLIRSFLQATIDIPAAEGLPLGLADKVFLGVDRADDLPIEGHLFGRTDRTATASYQLRPLGRPYIEAYLGGRCAAALEAEGNPAIAAMLAASKQQPNGRAMSSRSRATLDPAELRLL